MSKFIVMDIVFYGGSLNYDQGSGNYQELKKITKWDGKQYSFVSRYALRYSLLETGRSSDLWEIAEGGSLSLEGKGAQKVIQPAEELLYNGDILKYPEFDLFGYLITSTKPQNFREAPVKISHAISLTPFNYDSHFNANVGLANRIRRTAGDMQPNPFTSEEHITYYQYSIVIDLDRVGIIETYLQISNDEKKNIKLEKENEKLVIKLGKNKDVKILSKDNFSLKEIVLPIEEKNELKIDGIDVKFNDKSNVIIWKFELDEKKKIERIKSLIKAILKLKRSIKGREEDLSPKLLVLGFYENTPYKTFKEKIILKDEHTEEEYDEIEEKEENGKIIRKVIHKVTKSKKPVFEVLEYKGEIKEMNENNIYESVKNFLKNSKLSNNAFIYYTPNIKIENN